MRVSAVAQIADREIRERTRSQVFRIGTFLTVLIVVAAVVFPALAERNKPTLSYRIGVVDPVAPEITASLSELGPSLGGDIVIDEFDSVALGESALRADTIQVLVVPGKEIVTRVQIDPDVPTPIARLAAASEGLMRLYAGLENVGLSAEQSRNALNDRPLTVRGLEPAAFRNSEAASSSSAGMILLFVFLTLYGAFILNGVIEEKTSRVVEVLLSTARPAELLIGKVLGIGAVGTIQGVVLAAATFAARSATPNTAATSLTPAVLGYTMLWFVLGFGLYAGLYACAGALVSRSTDAQNLVFPLQIPLLSSYVVGLVASMNGPNAILNTMSYIPFTAPITMLERMAAQQVEWWEVLISIGTCVVTIYFVMRLAITIFAGGILRSGQRVRLIDAWRNPAR